MCETDERRRAAIQIFRAYGVAPKDGRGEIHALFDWVKHNVRYTRDIVRVELLHSARRLLHNPRSSSSSAVA